MHRSSKHRTGQGSRKGFSSPGLTQDPRLFGNGHTSLFEKGEPRPRDRS